MFHRVSGLPGEVHSRAFEAYRGDLTNVEVRELLRELIATGGFVRPERSVVLFATNLAPQLSGVPLESLQDIPGLRLQWMETFPVPPWVKPFGWFFSLLGSAIGGYSVGGQRGAFHLVEDGAGLLSAELGFQSYYEVQICSLRGPTVARELAVVARRRRELDVGWLEKTDDTYALVSSWYDDQSGRPELEMTTDFACGRSCSGKILEAVERFAATHG